ncbi:MAG: acyltransferase [Anaeroplasma bactoclasticum]|nr:acyltransferase [Anaeroplasma bactoclasticum]
MKKMIKKLLFPYYKMKYRVPALKSGGYIGKHSKIVNGKQMKFEKNVSIAPYTLICPHGKGVIHFGEGCEIGMFSRINANCFVSIGKNTITGPNLFISDHNHNYLNPNLPIKMQGDLETNNQVLIGEDCWIGTNVCIVGNVEIGKHCVIGANSFVNKSIPPYSVVVGNPAKIIKKYNFSTQLWEKVKQKQ